MTSLGTVASIPSTVFLVWQQSRKHRCVPEPAPALMAQPVVSQGPKTDLRSQTFRWNCCDPRSWPSTTVFILLHQGQPGWRTQDSLGSIPRRGTKFFSPAPKASSSALDQRHGREPTSAGPTAAAVGPSVQWSPVPSSRESPPTPCPRGEAFPTPARRAPGTSCPTGWCSETSQHQHQGASAILRATNTQVIVPRATDTQRPSRSTTLD